MRVVVIREYQIYNVSTSWTCPMKIRRFHDTIIKIYDFVRSTNDTATIAEDIRAEISSTSAS